MARMNVTEKDFQAFEQAAENLEISIEKLIGKKLTWDDSPV